MKTIQNIIIGFGKGGKTLAKFLAQKCEEVLVIEKSNQKNQIKCTAVLASILLVCHLSV